MWPVHNSTSLWSLNSQLANLPAELFLPSRIKPSKGIQELVHSMAEVLLIATSASTPNHTTHLSTTSAGEQTDLLSGRDSSTNSSGTTLKFSPRKKKITLLIATRHSTAAEFSLWQASKEKAGLLLHNSLGRMRSLSQQRIKAQDHNFFL